MTYRTIRGAARHTAADQVQVAHAVEVLSGEFGDYAAPDCVRDYLSDPQNALVVSADALAIILKPDSETQLLWLMWVRPNARGKGIGGALLNHIVDAFTTRHKLSLHCAEEREAFYLRHGFHTLHRWDGFPYMAGPAANVAEVQHLIPPFLRPKG